MNHHVCTILYPIANDVPATRRPPPGQPDNRVVDAIVFADGSQYNGTLRMGVPDGLGTCVWKDGNQYDGEWRQGVMHGFGTYLWTSGQRYDGQWRVGGAPRGVIAKHPPFAFNVQLAG